MASERVSAGLLMYRTCNQTLEVFLAHPGGPFFRNKDDGHWTIPKGEPAGDTSPASLLATALREFAEETGLHIDPVTNFIALGSIRQKGGKVVHAWAVEGDCPPGHCLKSNRFEIEWPPRSGKRQSFPEIDRAEFFPIDAAKKKINAAQIPLLERLEQTLAC